MLNFLVFSIISMFLFESVGESQTKIPLVIMTSDDTHSRTLELLESNSYFGMEPTQVKLLKQVRVVTTELLKKAHSRCYMNSLECYRKK